MRACGRGHVQRATAASYHLPAQAEVIGLGRPSRVCSETSGRRLTQRAVAEYFPSSKCRHPARLPVRRCRGDATWTCPPATQRQLPDPFGTSFCSPAVGNLVRLIHHGLQPCAGRPTSPWSSSQIGPADLASLDVSAHCSINCVTPASQPRDPVPSEFASPTLSSWVTRSAGQAKDAPRNCTSAFNGTVSIRGVGKPVTRAPWTGLSALAGRTDAEGLLPGAVGGPHSARSPAILSPDPASPPESLSA